MKAEKFWEIETKDERETLLKKMNNAEIDVLIEGSYMKQAKIYLASFKK